MIFFLWNSNLFRNFFMRKNSAKLENSIFYSQFFSAKLTKNSCLLPVLLSVPSDWFLSWSPWTWRTTPWPARRSWWSASPRAPTAPASRPDATRESKENIRFKNSKQGPNNIIFYLHGCKKRKFNERKMKERRFFMREEELWHLLGMI